MAGEKHPFDLSSAIALLGSVSPYPTSAAPRVEHPPKWLEPPSFIAGINPTIRPVNRVRPKENLQPDCAKCLSNGICKVTEYTVNKPQEEDPLPGERKSSLGLGTADVAQPQLKEDPNNHDHSPSPQVAEVIRIPTLPLSSLANRTEVPKKLSSVGLGRSKKPSGIHVFVDHSNVLIGFYQSLKKAKQLRSTKPAPVFSFHPFSLILHRGRLLEKQVLVGSAKSSPSVIEARDLNYEINILKRVKRDLLPENRNLDGLKIQRQAEQCVDEVIIMKMLESLVDYEPSTIVLATGDGNVAEFSGGFFDAVGRCLDCGWQVELAAFQCTLSKSWQKIRSPSFQIILLDKYIPHFTGTQ